MSAMVTTSISLLDRVRRSGNSQAWNRFVELYTPLIHYSVKRAGIPSSEVSDLVQEVFVLLIKKLPAFEYERRKSFRAWLSVITRNKCLDCLRRTPPLREAVGNDPLVANDAELVSEKEYRTFVTRRALELMQTEFEEKTWQACWALVVEGHSAIEISENLGMSTNAVYIAKSRVLRRLRDELADLVE